MFGIGMQELLGIMVMLMFVFGAGKLPKIGEGMGRAIKNFKDATSESDQESLKKGGSKEPL